VWTPDKIEGKEVATCEGGEGERGGGLGRRAFWDNTEGWGGISEYQENKEALRALIN